MSSSFQFVPRAPFSFSAFFVAAPETRLTRGLGALTALVAAGVLEVDGVRLTNAGSMTGESDDETLLVDMSSLVEIKQSRREAYG